MNTIEFMGMPKAGKSTQIELLETFLKHEKRQPTQVIYEGARTCPFDKSYRFSYHSWSFHTMINRILEAHRMSHNYLLVDRGIYDHITFSLALYKNGDFTKKQFTAQKEYFEEFLHLEERVLLLSIPPEIAMERAKRDYGRVMNIEFLRLLADSYQEALPYLRHPYCIVDGTKKAVENAEEILMFLG